ncbi:MAG: glycogen/starch synthase [Sediminibacterium sp.]|uniref:glycogen synthase n=1 Tax=Sediminibacterium sp. TaxID=1917865 RepID=UPI00271ABC3A|nr:glycogen/starch synthase [Sediminibacterium sp.]MDO8997518.1 glycogen/starch synthase [Sediminibacterium sp.]
MEIIHVSAECYPVAKAGGLGDVVGALPKYQCKSGDIAKVIMPMYRTKFLYENDWTVDFKGSANLGNWYFDFTVIKEPTNKLGFDLFLIDINGLLDRQKIYGYDDDAERFTAFQIAVVSWISSWEHQPDVVHCHDHHTALIPFIMKYCYDFQHLAAVSTVVTIHNGQYQGWMGWDKSLYIPRWDLWKRGMLDWAGRINPLASGVKCADKVTTVSWSYMDELRENANGLEALFEFEKGKCAGILNGIDNEVWNPSTDTYIENRFTVKTVTKGKEQNKKILCEQFGLDITKPLFVFIGRLVGEKAADILPAAIRTAIYQTQGNACFLILGSGETSIEWELQQMTNEYQGIYNAYIGYNEQLSHLIYAGADFLLMPSRVEPCGLNQMYAMRYGTIPVVRSTGGLKDTVTDMGDTDGFGIRFNYATIDDLAYSIGRGVSVYQDKKHMEWMRKHMMQIDHSWESTVSEYRQVYQSLK